MYLEQLGIYGWSEHDENLLLASLLTGDPLLLIGGHGCAKTHLGNKIAQALQKRYLVYDASKAMFEDVLGYPNTAKLQEGIVEYVPSPVTIWDKELVLIDELNRAVPELQSKWLEIIRSRCIMGFPTEVKWVWAAMNPVTYAGANALDEALIGRFAFFLYPPEVLRMNENDRVRVLTHINGDDAPSLKEWTDHGESGGTVKVEVVEETGRVMQSLLTTAAGRFLQLREQLDSLSTFLARFAALLAQESKGQITLDGRRLGFLYRNLLAARAVELAKAAQHESGLRSFRETARQTIIASIPIGLNDDGPDVDEATHWVEICFDLLAEYFEDGANLTLVNNIYEMLTSPNLMRKAELLFAYDLGEMAKSKAWNALMDEQKDLTVLAYTALQVEVRCPGTVPQELLESLSKHISPEGITSESIPALTDGAIQHVDEVEALLEQDSDLGRLVAYHHLRRLLEGDAITAEAVRETGVAIQSETTALARLLDNNQQLGDAA